MTEPRMMITVGWIAITSRIKRINGSNCEPNKIQNNSNETSNNNSSSNLYSDSSHKILDKIINWIEMALIRLDSANKTNKDYPC